AHHRVATRKGLRLCCQTGLLISSRSCSGCISLSFGCFPVWPSFQRPRSKPAPLNCQECGTLRSNRRLSLGKRGWSTRPHCSLAAVHPPGIGDFRERGRATEEWKTENKTKAKSRPTLCMAAVGRQKTQRVGHPQDLKILG